MSNRLCHLFLSMMSSPIESWNFHAKTLFFCFCVDSQIVIGQSKDAFAGANRGTGHAD